ncbi:hypothetical protein [Prevotella sp. KH2C16]|uniref:hypothetical protein n=1 Tax=Prevotella sp. KH2C16 TaxID=1855325 RepID=UPI0008E4CD63|nr:hypothetical protein [Prevotella sp. KH2C16]SFG12797.1 hypothetical protein SAMN05216383_105173 [Prevotella sp. KH2C16]
MKKTKKRKRIQLDGQHRRMIAGALGCSDSTVWNALAYRSDSETAQRVRSMALKEYGGVETYDIVFVNE